MIFSELRASAWKYAAIGCAVLAVAGLIAALFFRGAEAASRVRAVAAEQRAQALAGELEQSRKRAEALNAVAEKYEKDKRDAEAAQQRLVADLRAGNVRLQERWHGCEVSANATAAELDAAARDREASAARIVRAARDADDQIRGLQEVIRADRK